LARIFDFIAHDGREFESHKAETDHAERIKNEARVGWNGEISGGDTHTEAKANDNPEADQQRGRDKRADAAEIVHPFSDAEAHDVKDHEQNKEEHGSRQSESLVIREAGVAGAEHKNRDADEIKHHRWDVHHVVRPVAPAREEAVEVAEDLLGPKIDAALAGIAVGKLNHCDALWPEEKH